MKKLLIAFLAMCISAFCIIPFAGCNSGWVEVRHITYTTEEGNYEFVSTCTWDITRDGYIGYPEYLNIPEELQITNKYLSPTATEIQQPMSIYKNKFIADADGKVGKTFYYWSFTLHETFEKIIHNSYTLKYVKVRFMPDKTIEIDYDNNIISVNPITYEIMYFENEQ